MTSCRVELIDAGDQVVAVARVTGTGPTSQIAMEDRDPSSPSFFTIKNGHLVSREQAFRKQGGSPRSCRALGVGDVAGERGDGASASSTVSRRWTIEQAAGACPTERPSSGLEDLEAGRNRHLSGIRRGFWSSERSFLDGVESGAGARKDRSSSTTKWLIVLDHSDARREAVAPRGRRH